MSLVLYGLNKCSTCVKARAWLDSHGVAHTFVDYRDHPVDPALLRDWAAQLGGWEKLVNRASMTWRNLPESARSPADDAAWLALIVDYPALVRRPVAVDGDGKVGVGFREATYAARFLPA
ncbi:Spx/MgsR family RNA polymerase-binding regulatory protein [Kerstersia gyiorum]|uniref:Spx/MgsR family RNA polymerase-binding regulatory protein n=1 Tax=Kerstersia gyiorum TaxID=206506 RepID=UPI00209FED9F|nr:Spx/MgsR family RNA polymerase-binding regulatory protein [Kerstersia gyiorum]MCP1634509.1 Spx/MgsR family transcriptional regulator [Kerstersia gyiorum]MCP1637921.1 Spx/MgsR family transcriptional regulator [Kerstersia gyiorum]MCP1672397.1 Spx/MgsR family transcriptional regulator [Kerstersia gyiorum]MCP1680477.1 Spx/MgsR family transcriptional regulator [Kerstersia gyiorum]MCP1683648.1 Spx/MgsR family transcriptional regulator [Kerstersia gyiorum]